MSVISSAGGLELATGASEDCHCTSGEDEVLGEMDAVPMREMPEGHSVPWGGRAQEESRMEAMGRKGPWAGRPAPVESAMFPPGCVTLGKPLLRSG